ncbi:hypothetical protein BCD67_15370 [Oscillatoriales cyanobacterium USR001]|nr:hypothetical protein BCD67_15370 [Oscillatoriales cyanobacterium USR001]
MKTETSWLEKSVQDFFGNCNWMGIPRTSQNGSVTGKTLSLTSSVGEFFRGISWEGIPEVGAMPTPLPVATISTKESTEVTLDDLLDLF